MRLKISDLGSAGQFDYCIIGTGPAGITCALELAAAGNRVALLEGGLDEYTDESQDLFQGKVVGDEYFELRDAHLRFFGGTSNHWAGFCKILDAIDFEAKPGIDNTEWPIRKSDIAPYLDKARDILEVPPFPADEPFLDSGFKRTFFEFSPPVAFSEKYGDAITKHPNIALVLDANLMDFSTNGTAVTTANVRDTPGNEYQVAATRFILAAGGIENSRILLWGNEKTNGQLVKNATSLGKYWMEHPSVSLGDVLLKTEFTGLSEEHPAVHFGPTDEFITRNRILNLGLSCAPIPYKGTKAIIADLLCVAPDLGKWIFDQFDKGLYCGGRFSCGLEQAPLAENRIELSDEVDALGMPRTVLYWKRTGLEMRSIQVAARSLADYLAKNDLGRVHFRPWVLDDQAEFPDDNEEMAQHHHMGGTRMSDNPDLGIVDSNCKVFGQENLYIAGSSVFTSGGYANPTLSIVQLSLRLSEHLKTL